MRPIRGLLSDRKSDVAVGGSARRRPDSNRGHHDLTPRGRTVHAHPGLRSVPPRPGDTDSAQPERHLPDPTTGPTRAERGAACHAQSKQRFLGEGGAFLGVALEARTIGSAVRRRARDLGPRSHAVPVLGRSDARPPTRRASRRMVICSGIRERYAQAERRPARGLRYRGVTDPSGRALQRGDPTSEPSRVMPSLQHPETSRAPDPTARVTPAPCVIPRAQQLAGRGRTGRSQAGGAGSKRYLPGIAFGSTSSVTSPH